MKLILFIIIVTLLYLVIDRFMINNHINHLSNVMIESIDNQLNNQIKQEQSNKIISNKKSLVCFIRIPKNASTSVYTHLLNNNINRDENLIPLFQKPQYQSIFAPSHCKISESLKTLKHLEFIIGSNLKSIPFLAVCRNPYDRMVSMYTYFINNKKIEKFKTLTETINTFKKFINFCIKNINQEEYALLWMCQVDYLDNNEVDLTIIRYEYLNTDFEKFIKDKNLKNIDINLPWLNQSNDLNYNTYYTPKLRKKVYNLWEKDFVKFNYSKD